MSTQCWKPNHGRDLFIQAINLDNDLPEEHEKNAFWRAQMILLMAENPANQLRLVFYPMILRGFSTMVGGFLAGFQPSTVGKLATPKAQNLKTFAKKVSYINSTGTFTLIPN